MSKACLRGLEEISFRGLPGVIFWAGYAVRKMESSRYEMRRCGNVCEGARNYGMSGVYISGKSTLEESLLLRQNHGIVQ